MKSNISVIIPLYNKGYIIERCLTSVENQTVHPDEVIIVNDGSLDNSLQLVKQYCLKSKLNIKIIEQENKGVSYARNNGIQQAKSNYVALLDADDEWMPEILERAIDLICKYPEAVLYTFKHQVRDDLVGLFTPNQKFGFTKTGYITNYLKLAMKYPLLNSSKVFMKKTSILGFHGFPAEGKICEDLYVWIRMSEIGPFAYDDYIGVTINQFNDFSRSERSIAIPYPIKFYSDDYRLPINKELRMYLWSIHWKHILGSMLDSNRSEALLRLKSAKNIFGLKNCFLYLFLLLPSCLFRKLKILKRKSLYIKNRL